MKKIFGIVIKVLLSVVALIALYIGGNILYSTVTDYQPPPREELPVHGTATAQPDRLIRLMIWNIGYGGLGAEMDFFYDGGETVVAPEAMVDKYLNGIYRTVEKHKGAVDCFLFQEVDTAAKRSHGINELRQLSERLEGYAYSFATNYNVKFVVVPYTNPMGHVLAGLASFSRFQPQESIRFSFPGNYAWPKRNYLLDRCFLVQRFPLPGGKALVVINTHNSAYDDGTLKQQQMAFLKDKLLAEYEKGNYVIVGGDWNQCPPGFDPKAFAENQNTDYGQLNIPGDYLPGGWQWAYDPQTPTNRKLATPYRKGETFTTLIDFYLVSPNVRVEEVQGIDLDFGWADHQPVLLTVRLE